MLASARQRAGGEGWRNLELVQGDAARTELPAESFDAALCILGLSVIPDHRAAIARVGAALKGGGRLVVLDGRPGPLRGRGRLLNPALKPLFRYVYNADVDKDLVPDLERAFDAVAVDEFNAGSLFIAAARKAAVRPGRAAHDPATKGQSDGRLEASGLLRASERTIRCQSIGGVALDVDMLTTDGSQLPQTSGPELIARTLRLLSDQTTKGWRWAQAPQAANHG